MASAGNAISAQHQGPAVNLAVWISLVVSSLAVLLKVTSKALRNQRSINFKNWGPDDYSIIAAVIFAIVHSTILSAQVSSGLGQPEASLDAGILEAYQKRGFAAQFFYILTVALSQLSCLFFVLSLARDRPHEVVSWIALGATICWFIICAFILGFQCHGPQSWAIISGKCVDQAQMWSGVEGASIFLDVALVAVPIFLLWDLQMPWDKKSIVIGGFAMRLIVVPLVVLRLVAIHKAGSSPDHTLREWKVAVFTTVILNVSLLVTCLPFLKPLMDQLQTGWYAGDVRTGFGFSTAAHGSKDYGMDYLSPKSSPTIAQADSVVFPSGRYAGYPIGNALARQMVGGSVHSGPRSSRRPTITEDEDESRPSSSGSKQHMIGSAQAYRIGSGSN